MNKMILGTAGMLILAAAFFAAAFFSSRTLEWERMPPSAAVGAAATSLAVDVAMPPGAPRSDAQQLSVRSDSGVREYRNARYRFSLPYPEHLSVKEFDESGDAMTITFENSKEALGFQIFVTPYGEAQVSEERFRQDVPSRVRKELADVTIDGATGASFYSGTPFLARPQRFGLCAAVTCTK